MGKIKTETTEGGDEGKVSSIICVLWETVWYGKVAGEQKMRNLASTISDPYSFKA